MSSEAEASPVTEAPVEVQSRRKRWTAKARALGLDLWYPVVVSAAALILSALAISGSSLAIWSAGPAPDESAIVAGNPRPIRSDEWLVISPIKTGQVRAGFPAERTFGMGTVDFSDSWRPQMPSRAIPAALYSPFNLPLVLLPIDQGFALYWWLPFVACALGVYAWLRLMGVGRGVAFAASLVTTTAPVAMWWSGWICLTLALAVLPCAILMAATRLWPRRRGAAIAVALVAGLAAAPFPWSYQPWAVPAGIAVGLLTLIWGLADPGRRRAFLVLGAIAGAVFVLESAVFFLHERAYYQALSDTVYPGARRETGGGMSLGQLFSSLFPYLLAGDAADRVVGTNVSEISMGWSITAPIAVFLAMLGLPALRRDKERLLLFGSLGVTALLAAWCFVQWPETLARVTLLTFSQPVRAAPFLGFAGTVSLALLLGTPERRARLRQALGTAGIVMLTLAAMFVAAWAATDFRNSLLGVSNVRVGIVVLAVGALIVLCWSRWQRIGLAAAVAIAVTSGALVNPLMHGLGAIENSHAAAQVTRIDSRLVQPVHGNWAADSLAADALLNGQGINSLSSYNDPVDAKGWRVIDARGVYETQWNRYAYIAFDWKPELLDPVISNPANDVIVVSIDPCDARLSKLHLAAIISSEPIDEPCLAQLTTLRWHGQRFTVYRVS